MTDTDMLHMAALEKRCEELEARNAELEAKHWDECRQIAHYDNELSKYQKEMPKIVEYIDYLRSLPVNRWISIKERLPEDNTIVLYVWRSENGNVSVFHGWHSSIRGLGSAWHQSGVGMQRPDDEVTHWMPLPEPPKDGGAEDEQNKRNHGGRQ